MLKDKKKLFIILSVVIVLLICIASVIFFLINDTDKNNSGNNDKPNEEIVIPDAPAENTEDLVQEMKKVEVKQLNNDVIKFSEKVEVETGEKVAVWVYSTPKFLGYFEVVLENGVKMIKGLEEAMKEVELESGEHNLAIVTEEGTSIGYIDIYVEENKLFEDEEAAIVSKYTTKEVVEKLEIKYQTETKKDSNKKSGSKEVTQKGENGESEITYKITYDETGKEISKEKVSEKVIKKAVKEIIVVGTSNFSTNSSKITGEFIGFMCSENQTMEYDGVKGCDDSQELPSFKAIVIDDSVNYVVSVNNNSITPVKITKSGSLYKGTYNGKTHYFDVRGGGGNPDGEPLTEELCKQYNLSCGSW